jgi:hypothetical protein
VGYRPKPGKQEALMRTHFARLYEQGLVTRRRPFNRYALPGERSIADMASLPRSARATLSQEQL